MHCFKQRSGKIQVRMGAEDHRVLGNGDGVSGEMVAGILQGLDRGVQSFFFDEDVIGVKG